MTIKKCSGELKHCRYDTIRVRNAPGRMDMPGSIGRKKALPVPSIFIYQKTYEQHKNIIYEISGISMSYDKKWIREFLKLRIGERIV